MSGRRDKERENRGRVPRKERGEEKWEVDEETYH